MLSPDIARRAKAFHGWVAGYNAYDRLRLARAEVWAANEGLERVIVPDDSPWDGDCPAPFEQVGVMLVRPCPEHGTDCKHAEVLGSLWGVGLTGDAHEDNAIIRQIAAEIALEVM